MNDLVTVYIPTHNRKRLLKRAVESVLAQTYSNIEIIIVNDGSNDGTKDYLDYLSSSFTNIKAINLDESSGACNARNLAINIAEGKYITGLDDDDEFDKIHIESLYKKFDSNKYSFICINVKIFDGNKYMNRNSNVGKIELNSLLHHNKVGNQIFTLTERIRSTGGFNLDLPSFQDYELWVRLVKLYGTAKKYNHHTYTQYIDHELGRISTSKWKINNGLKEFVRINSRYMDEEHYKSMRFLFAKQNNYKIGFINTLKYVNRFNYQSVLIYYINKVLHAVY